LLGCREGRSANEWVEFDFFGHQIAGHLSPGSTTDNAHNRVDGNAVPVRHFGVVLAPPDWRQLAGNLRERGVKSLVGPTVRFEGLPGEQATMFFQDPGGNDLEITSFTHDSMVFSR